MPYRRNQQGIGGLLAAAAEMAFAGGMGAKVSLASVPTSADARLSDAALLFSESNTRTPAPLPVRSTPSSSGRMPSVLQAFRTFSTSSSVRPLGNFTNCSIWRQFR